MNSVEDQVRAATRAEASTMREVRPLRLPPAPGAAPARPLAFRPRRWRGWMVPVTAAVAVVAVAISLVIVRDISNGPVVPPTAPVPASTVPPRYYVAISGSATAFGWYAYAPLTSAKKVSPNDLVVGDTMTGRKLATIAAPAGSTWAGVTAAADDRTFVAYALPGSGASGAAGHWYLVTLTPGAASADRITRLPIEPLAAVGAMALSGSGQQLAVVLAPDNIGSRPTPNGKGKKTLCVYSVATGGLLHPCWTTREPAFFMSDVNQAGELYPSLSWIDGDQAIAFPAPVAIQLPNGLVVGGRDTMRSLSLASKGTSLMADSKVIWSKTYGQKAEPPCDGGYLAVSADGTTVSCSSYTELSGRNYPWRMAWLTYPTSAAAHPGGRPVTDYQFTLHFPWQGLGFVPPLWVDPSGSVLLVAWLTEKNGRDVTHFGVVRQGKFNALPVPSAIVVPQVFFSGIPTAIAW